MKLRKQYNIYIIFKNHPLKGLIYNYLYFCGFSRLLQGINNFQTEDSINIEANNEKQEIKSLKTFLLYLSVSLMVLNINMPIIKI